MAPAAERAPELVSEAGTSPPALRAPDRVLLFAIGLLARLPLVFAYPAVHGDDSVLRLARSDELLVGYWLPLPQLVVYVTRALAPDPCWARVAFTLLGALTPVALAELVAATAGLLSARAAGVLAALHPLLVHYSTVPYQEVLALPLLLVAALALLRGRDVRAGLALGCACLSRYEAWIAAGLAALVPRGRPLRAAALFGWAPIVWLLVWGGLGPPGSFVLDLDPNAARLPRLAFLAGKLREYGGDLLPALALVGVVVARRRRLASWGWGGAFVLLYLAAQVAVGHEFPPGSGFVSERMAHVPALASCALAGLALGAAQHACERRGLRVPAAAAACVLLAWLGTGWQRRNLALAEMANDQPSLRLAYAVARLAHSQLSDAGRLAVAGPPLPVAAIEAYFLKVERAGGDVRRARAIVQAMPPPDVIRVRAHLPRPPPSVCVVGEAAAELVAVFDDAPGAERLRAGTLVGRFVHGARGVTVYRR
jgi:hypothetical protein